MQRRTTAFLLIAFGLIVIIGVGFWLFWPTLKPTTAPVQQPPGYSTSQAQAPIIDQTVPIRAPLTPAAQLSLKLEERLRRTAQEFVSRTGSYSNADGFSAMHQAGLGATAGVQAYLDAERDRLTKLYPLANGSWGQTARGLASRVTSGTPIVNQTAVTIQVDAQIITEAGMLPPVTSYAQANVTFQKAGTDWSISRLEWTEAGE